MGFNLAFKGLSQQWNPNNGHPHNEYVFYRGTQGRTLQSSTYTQVRFYSDVVDVYQSAAQACIVDTLRVLWCGYTHVWLTARYLPVIRQPLRVLTAYVKQYPQFQAIGRADMSVVQ
jgi:hypothetical protein